MLMMVLSAMSMVNFIVVRRRPGSGSSSSMSTGRTSRSSGRSGTSNGSSISDPTAAGAVAGSVSRGRRHR